MAQDSPVIINNLMFPIVGVQTGKREVQRARVLKVLCQGDFGSSIDGRDPIRKNDLNRQVRRRKPTQINRVKQGFSKNCFDGKTCIHQTLQVAALDIDEKIIDLCVVTSFHDDVNELHREGLACRLEINRIGVVHGVASLEAVVQDLPRNERFSASCGVGVIQTTWCLKDASPISDTHPFKVAHCDVHHASNGIAQACDNIADWELIRKLVQVNNAIVVSQTDAVGSDDWDACRRSNFKHVDAPIVERFVVEVIQPCCKINGRSIFIGQVQNDVEIKGF